jgi:hypothetical protein
VSARDKVLAGAVDQVLAGISDVTGFVEKLEAAGGNGRLIAAIRTRLTAPPPEARKPDAAIWAEAAERMVVRR